MKDAGGSDIKKKDFSALFNYKEDKREVFFVMRSLLPLMMIFMLLPVSAAAAKTGASDVITKFNAALLESMMKADELGYQGRYRALEPVIKDTFALPFMATQSVGRYGKSLKDEEKAVFLRTYIEWTIATYAGRFDGYSGEKFETVSESAPENGTVTVLSKLIEKSSNSIAFNYKLRKVDDKWRIVDIQMAGVNQLALTRSQFVSVIKEKGLDGLVAMLKEKIRVFSQGKGQ